MRQWLVLGGGFLIIAGGSAAPADRSGPSLEEVRAYRTAIQEWVSSQKMLKIHPRAYVEAAGQSPKEGQAFTERLVREFRQRIPTVRWYSTHRLKRGESYTDRRTGKAGALVLFYPLERKPDAPGAVTVRLTYGWWSKGMATRVYHLKKVKGRWVPNGARHLSGPRGV